jgi:hypothetical protein
MLIANKFRHALQLFIDGHTILNPGETAMTAQVTIFGKNS